MRRNIYHKDIAVFLRALQNLGWREITPNKRLHEREFINGSFHLILRKRKLGHYCLIHKDRVALRRHVKAITKGDELRSVYREITEEYKRIVR